MKYDNLRLTCRSVEPFFTLEKDGLKPNTIRVVPVDELVALARCEVITVRHYKTDGTDGADFGRTITDITDITEPLVDWGEVVCPEGFRIVCISWEVLR